MTHALRKRSSKASAALALLAAAGSVAAHGGLELGPDGQPKAAEVAGLGGPLSSKFPLKVGKDSYIQKHMASEHHIASFDLGAFFAIHDLNSDGILDRSEIEAIYGVHHTMSRKHSKNAEVHDEKADFIVGEVLRRLDVNFDGLITKREFYNGGIEGLPTFEQYGKDTLGHHYDEESEFFVHHEELMHNTPETQKDDAYTHKEDIEHFAHHDKIENEEEERERHAEGMPSREEDEKLRKAAAAKGEHYQSPYDAQMDAAHLAAEDDAHAPGFGFAAEEINTDQHIFRTPNGHHVVHTNPDSHFVYREPERMEGETNEGYEERLHAWRMRMATLMARRPGEQDKSYLRRLSEFEKLITGADPERAHLAQDDSGEHYNRPARERNLDEMYADLVKKAKLQDKHELISKGGKAFKEKEEKRRAGETEAQFRERMAKNKIHGQNKEEYGKGSTGFKYPKADEDRMRKGTPYKYRMKKKQFWGEF
ncbi:hypothetical protein OC834_002563 [Tilletia horrida]|nr:hypothetical protein OC835_004167 [Tilletia horrida]KAK0532529.1 hypothetical protein OC834_002563 [Tilletia horrida]